MTGAAPTRITVAVDGPASSGKSSVGMAVAQRLGLRFLDTGLIYRALTALALGEGIAPDDQPAVIALIGRFELGDDGHGRLDRVLVDGVDRTDAVHTHEVDAAVSALAQQPDVRSALLEPQRRLALAGGILMAGRDIGTVVLPDAGLKVYLDASVEERARRRARQRGIDPDGFEGAVVREQLRARDAVDAGRAVAPLRAASDAVVLTTDGMEFDEVADLVAGLVIAAEAERAKAEPAIAATDPATAPGPAPDATLRPVPTLDATPASAPGPAPDPATASGPAPDATPRPVPTLDPAPAAVEPPAPATARAKPSEARPPAAGRTSRVLEVAMRLDNHQSMLVRMVARVSQWISRAFASVSIEGLEHVPRTGAVIVAANHASNFDPMLVGSWISDALRTRRIHWLGKRELFSWPLFGWMCAYGGVHPVDRSSADVEAYRLATRILEKGYVLLIFPEGTRSPTGALQEAKDGMAQLALRTGALILPVGVNNSDFLWPKGRKFPRPFPRRRIRVRIGEPFRAADVVPPATDRRAAKTAATTAMMGRIAELLEPRQRGAYASAVRPLAEEEPVRNAR